MNFADLTPLAVFAMFAGLVVKEILASFGKLPSRDIRINPDDKMERQRLLENNFKDIKDLLRRNLEVTNRIHEMHDQKDGDGVYVWYVRKSLETAISKFSDNIEAQTRLMESLVNNIKSLDDDVDDLKEMIRNAPTS